MTMLDGPKLRGRCRCGHWAFFHRADRFDDNDPCRVGGCGCGYFEHGLEVPPERPAVAAVPGFIARLDEMAP